MGRRRLDLRKLPRGAEVFDTMGNDPRREGRKEWEIGVAPLFVMSQKLSAEQLMAAGQTAIHD